MGFGRRITTVRLGRTVYNAAARDFASLSDCGAPGPRLASWGIAVAHVVVMLD
jgi:hypothetical protein